MNWLLLVGIVVVDALVSPLFASDFRMETVGVRGGIGIRHDDRFRDYEAFGALDLPWRWDWGDGWGLQTKMDVSAGVWELGPDYSFVGQAGLLLSIGSAHCPIELEVGSNPTLLSHQRLGYKDLGSVFLFTSHADLRMKLGKRWTTGIRFQHSSNAGLARKNPGLNMVLFSAGYRF